MPRKQGLTRSDFKRMGSAGFRREHGALLSLSSGILPGAGIGPKITCVVSKKTAARAVDRNLIKRRCRAAARACLEGKTAAQKFALVFYAKRASRGAPYAAVKEEIERLIGKAVRER